VDRFLGLQQLNKLRNYIILCLMLSAFMLAPKDRACAQNAGIGTVSPNASSILDLTSTTLGLLVPRMTTAQKTAITSPATGLLVYDGTLNLFYYWNSSAWVPFQSSATGWSLTGNAGTVMTTNFLGTTDAIDLHIRTKDVEHIAITKGGYMGVDTMSPASPLDVIRNAPSGYGTAVFRTLTSGYGAEIGGVGSYSTYGAIRGVNSSGATADLYFNSTLPGGVDGNVSIANTAPNTKLDVSGDLALRRYDTTAVSGNNNNFSTNGYSFVRISSASAAFTITGLSGGADGKILILYNATTQNMTIANASSSSTAANEILTMSGASVSTVGAGCAEFIYSGTDTKWILLSLIQ
jgi:hypothetical protein